MGKKPTYKELEERIAKLEKTVAAHKKREKTLKKKEKDTLSFLDNAPIALIEFDGTGLKRYFDTLKKKGVTDLKKLFREDENAHAECLKRLKPIRVNHASREMLGDPNQKGDALRMVLDPEESEVSIQRMAALAEGRTEFAYERVFRPAGKDPVFTKSTFRVLPGHEDTLARICISTTDITSRRQAEAALEKNLQLQSEHWEIIESLTSIGVASWDSSTGVVENSDGIYRIFGLDPSTAKNVGEYSTSLIHPEDKTRVAEAHAGLAEIGYILDVKYRIVLPDGNIRWLHSRGGRFPEADGDGEMVVVFVIDNNEVLAHERALKESEERYRALYGNAVVAMFRTALEDSRALEVNQIGFELFGYASKEEFLSEFRAVDHYVEASTRKELLKALSETGEVSNYIVEFKRKDGTHFWAEFNAKIYREEGYLEGAVIDITDRKLSETALIQAESRFRSLFEDSPLPLFEINCAKMKHYFDELKASGVQSFRKHFKAHPDDAARAGLLADNIRVNDAAVEAFGAESREMLAEGFTRLGGKQFTDDWTKITTALAEGKKSYKKDIRMHTFKGNLKNFAMKWSVPKESLETLDSVYIAMVDITSRKRMELELKRSESKLKRKAEKLENTNTAMDVLLGKRLSDKKELEETMLYNVRELVLPYINKLKNDDLSHRQRTYVGILERNLNNVMSPFLRGMSLGQLRFTKSELQVVNCLKEGMSTRQMAELFNLSPRTVESYRDNIREKLGIKKKKLNLRTYLMARG